MSELFDAADAELFERMRKAGWRPLGDHKLGRDGDWRDPDGYVCNGKRAVERFLIQEQEKEGGK